MSNNQCSHFSFFVKTMPLQELHNPIRLPSYQCVVADTMRTRLRSLLDGETLASALEHTAPDGTRHSFYGPDMQSLSPIQCTEFRCQQSCLPAFTDLMTDLGLDPTIPTADQEP